MDKKPYTPPRKTLAANLDVLLKAHNMTGPECASKAQIDRKSVNNMINARYDPKPENVDAVARVFGLTGWLLLMPWLKDTIPQAAEIEMLLGRYSAASDEQRETIMKVAEMSGSYENE